MSDRTEVSTIETGGRKIEVALRAADIDALKALGKKIALVDANAALARGGSVYIQCSDDKDEK